MEPKHTARERIYLQWQQNIEAYMDELQQIDSTVRQLTHQLPDMLLLQHLIALRNRILLHKGLMSALLAEVDKQRSRLTHSAHQAITIGDLMQRHRLREKISKAEQEVFQLKCRVGQVLSQAS